MSSPTPRLDAKALIAAAALGVPVVWENEPFTAPDNSLWVDIQMAGDESGPIELGGATWQENGRLYAFVNAPAQSGSIPAATIAENLLAAFRGLGPRAGLPVWMNGSIGMGQPSDEDGAWWTIRAMVEYQYQTQKT